MTTRAHHKFWPARLPHAIEPPATGLADNLQVSARRFPHRPALVFLGHTTTYAELAAQVARVAAWLAGQGIVHFALGRYCNYRSNQLMGVNLSAPVVQLQVLVAIVLAPTAPVIST